MNRSNFTTRCAYTHIARVAFVLLMLLPVYAQAQIPQFAYLGAASQNATSVPFNSANNKVQWIYLPSEITPVLPAGRINVLYLRSYDDYPEATFQNLLFRMAHTTLTSFLSGTFITSGVDSVMSAAAFAIPEVRRGEWIPFALHKPFVYDGSRNIIVEVSRTGGTSPLEYIQYGNTTNRRIHGVRTAASGTMGAGPAVMGFDLAGPDDAGITLIHESVQVCPYTIKARLANMGTNKLTQVQIHWELDGVLQAPVSWTTPLDTFGSVSGNTAVVNLGTFPFTAGGARRVKVWTSRPNGVTDPAPYNDTAWATFTASTGIAPGQITDTIPGSHCGPGAVILGARGTGSILHWYDTIAGGTMLGTGSPYTTPPIAGTTTFYVAAGNSAGCESARVPVTATIHQPPLVAIQPSGTASLCAGDSLPLYASSGIGFSYQWYKDQAPVPGASYSVFKAGAPGSYTVRVADNEIGCSGVSRPVTVEIKPLPEPVIYFDGTTLSTGQYITYQWSLNGRLIPGADSRTYPAAASGHYTVTVRDANGCTNTSAAYPVGVSSIGQYGEGALRIYPNPAAGWVYLDVPPGTMISFYGMEGKELMKIRVCTPHTPIDISNLPEGLYAVRITDANGRRTDIGKMFKMQTH